MVTATGLYRSVDTALLGVEQTKNNAATMQNALRAFSGVLNILDIQSKWAGKMNGQATTLAGAIDGIGIIYPISHFVIEQSYKTATCAHNVFVGCIAFISVFDLKDFLNDAANIDLGKYAATLGQNCPVIGRLTAIPFSSFVPYVLIVAFTARGIDAYNTYNDRNSTAAERQAAVFRMAYSAGTVAVTVFGLVAANPVAVGGFSCAVQVIGLVDGLYRTNHNI